MPPRDLTVIHPPAGAAGRVLPAGVRRPPADPARRVLPAGVRRPPADPAKRLLPDGVARPAAKLTGQPRPSRTPDPPPVDSQDDREAAAAVPRRAESAPLRSSSAISRMSWDSIRANPRTAIVAVVLAAWLVAAVTVTLLVLGFIPT